MNYKESIKNFVDRLPYVRTLKKKAIFYESRLTVAPGHFYSPIVDSDEIIENENKIFDPNRSLEGIVLNKEAQFELLNIFKEYYKLLPFTEEPINTNRYFYNNDAYSYSDAIFLFSITMHYKPQRIIEIGSGYSSAAMLDINEKFFSNSIDLTFIEPFPETLKYRTRQGDKYTLIEKKVQDADSNIFKSLKENDILFIDSTHVAKTNSDVLFELFEILPVLCKGVKVHIHDIFYPFEYPKEWVIDQKRNWNEIYLLRAFLMYNSIFKIIAFNTYAEQINAPWFEENMPLCLKNRGGSIWLEKIG